MMFFQGCALATSPQGASQTILRPGISGVPEARADVARSVWAVAGNGKAMASSAIAGRTNLINKIQFAYYVARFRGLFSFTRFLHANRYPLRLKTLCQACLRRTSAIESRSMAGTSGGDGS